VLHLLPLGFVLVDMEVELSPVSAENMMELELEHHDVVCREALLSGIVGTQLIANAVVIELCLPPEAPVPRGPRGHSHSVGKAAGT